MNEEWKLIITAVISALTVLIPAVLTFRARYKKIESEEHSTDVKLITDLLTECKQLREVITQRDAKITELQTAVQNLQLEVHGLKLELERYKSSQLEGDSPKLLEALMNHLDFPCWFHEVNNNKWFVNDCYCVDFNISRNTFWSPINILAFPVDIAAEYTAHGLRAIQSGSLIKVKETVTRNIMQPVSKDNPGFEILVTKIPIILGSKSYILGYCDKLPPKES